MLYSATHNAIFLHIHKAAGGSVSKALREHGFDKEFFGKAIRNHITAHELIDLYPPAADCFIFTVVRNPFSRLVSTYYWVREFGRKTLESSAYRFHRQASRETMNGFKDFASYVDFLHDSYLEIRPLHRRLALSCTPHPVAQRGVPVASYPPQTSYTTDIRGTSLISAWGRVETLDEDMAHLYAHLGLPEAPVMQRRRQSSSSKIDYKDLYTNRTIDKVARLFEDDLERFGYDFDRSVTPSSLSVLSAR